MSVPARPTGRPRPHRGLLALGLGLALMPGTVVAQGASPATSPDATELRPLSVGLGYIPSVQFAPFYLAQTSGMYADAGLDVTLQNQIDPDLITLIAQGAVRPIVGARFPLERAQEAIVLLDERGATGKVVLDVR